MESVHEPASWKDSMFADGTQAYAWLYIKEQEMDIAMNIGYEVKVVKKFEDFRVGRLSLKFINPETRPKTIGKRVLLRLQPLSVPQ